MLNKCLLRYLNDRVNAYGDYGDRVFFFFDFGSESNGGVIFRYARCI